MRKDDVISYSKIREIILSCPDPRTQALLSFQYAAGARIGEIAMWYNHAKHKSVDKKMVFVSHWPSDGIRTASVSFPSWGIEWDAPNFKGRSKRLGESGLRGKKPWVTIESEPWLYNILFSWANARKASGEEFLFSIGERRCRQLVDKELKKYNPDYRSHSLRFSRATHIGDVSGDPYVVQEILGHGDVRTSGLYVRVSRIRIMSKLEGKTFEGELG
jgi:site-specific recombinase XerC